MLIQALQTPEENEPEGLNLLSLDNYSIDNVERDADIFEVIKDGGIEPIPVVE
ncbi:hypothetical protein [Pseudomonas sp. D1HM]|uniref:hypothetical protein n=1 Tax=Pseudomonas sp. D1HM TaxID=1784816 RepID=UPI001C4FC9EE|nr:hypothetical protein [Pseudomonas sp. D1HM]